MASIVGQRTRLRGRTPRRVAMLVGVLGLVLGSAAIQGRAQHGQYDRGEHPAGLGSLADYDGVTPDDTVLLEQLHHAIELRRREDFDRVLDAREAGELIEHATLTEAMFETAPIAVDTLFIVGDELFGLLFRPENGWGAGG